MKKYDNYKNSGIEWIGEIPQHWEINRLKNIGKLYSGLSGKSGSDFEKAPTNDYKPFINFTNIANNKYIVSDNFGFVKIYSNENQNQVKKHDLFFLMSSENQEDVGKSALLLEDFGELYLNSFCKGFRLTNNFDARFINYLLSSSALSQIISLEGKGFTRINLRMEGVENLPIFLPESIAEQTAIANFLDYKTTQIDTLILKKEAFISLLQEERIAVINQAVTKGLDPNVPMKDSGVEWLGEIPEHWAVKKLKYLLKENKDALKTGPFGSHIKNSDFIPDGKYKVYTQRNVLDNEYENGCEGISEEKFKELRGFLVHDRDVLITTRGSIGRCSIFPKGQTLGILHPCLIRVQVNEDLSLNDWVVNYINNTSLFYNNVKFNSNSTIIDVIYGYTLKEIFFPVPTLSEQKTILDFLDTKLNEIESLISKSQQEIELLKEYKTALISEVVTGKVDVRNVIIN
jgi:type I restriction enzyme S subunit